jgi:DNA-binding NarL/FixJ family response regulator
LKWQADCTHRQVPRIRVLVADDHRETLECVKQWLSPEFDVVAAVADGQAALEAAARWSPDVAVLDISMPVLDGIQAAKDMRAADPDIKIVFLTVEEDPSLVLAVENLALGFVLKSQLTADLKVAIQMAMQGRRFVSSKIR